MLLAALPVEAMVLIGVLIASAVLACMKVIGADLEHDTALWKLRIEARRVRNERYAKLMAMQRAEAERMAMLTRKPWEEQPVGVDVVDEAEVDDAPTAMAA